MNIFEIATREKFRFPYKGIISTEDLFDLSLENLDSIFKTLSSKNKQSQEESLLNIKSKNDEMIETQIEIIKHIVTIKQEEMKNRLQEVENRKKKQRILSIIENKQESEMENKSIEELNAMLNELK